MCLNYNKWCLECLSLIITSPSIMGRIVGEPFFSQPSSKRHQIILTTNDCKKLADWLMILSLQTTVCLWRISSISLSGFKNISLSYFRDHRLWDFVLEIIALKWFWGPHENSTPLKLAQNFNYFAIPGGVKVHLKLTLRVEDVLSTINVCSFDYDFYNEFNCSFWKHLILLPLRKKRKFFVQV